MPARSSVSNRSLSRVGERRGTPRRMSLKRRAPASSSRTTSSVQRSASTSDDKATGQNWPYSWRIGPELRAAPVEEQAFARSRFRTGARGAAARRLARIDPEVVVNTRKTKTDLSRRALLLGGGAMAAMRPRLARTNDLPVHATRPFDPQRFIEACKGAVA